MQTIRQRILSLLEQNICSSYDLAQSLFISERDVEGHLTHIIRSLQCRDTQQFRMHPATCRHCGFVFHTRQRLTCPARCPSCKHEQIVPPRFEIITRKTCEHEKL